MSRFSPTDTRTEAEEDRHFWAVVWLCRQRLTGQRVRRALTATLNEHGHHADETAAPPSSLLSRPCGAPCGPLAGCMPQALAPRGGLGLASLHCGRSRLLLCKSQSPLVRLSRESHPLGRSPQLLSWQSRPDYIKPWHLD